MTFFKQLLTWPTWLSQRTEKTPAEGTTIPAWTSLQDMLRDRSKSQGRVIIYPLDQISSSTAQEHHYSTLYTQARKKSHIVRNLDGFSDRKPVLLHFDNHWDNIVWFWATLFANGLPVMSSPFTNHSEHRERHILGLSELLEAPICLTRERSLNSFGSKHTMRIYTIESLHENHRRQVGPSEVETHQVSLDSTAVLMLTSGSTGNAKAVQITHRQILAAVEGKARVRPLHNRPFLNWIGLDHVAGLVEIHLQALYLGYDQIHVQAVDIVSSPTLFLDLLDRHHVCRTFAPNFFLAKLVKTLKEDQRLDQSSASVSRWDLSSLVTLGTGGEANETETCLSMSNILRQYGAPSDAILPGFGMTETCAGIIYNKDCPASDIAYGYRFASLGRCIERVEMRLTLPVSSETKNTVLLATPGVAGLLEVRGTPIFRGYYRNAEATAEAFTSDGWFKTGDTGIIDAIGNLILRGRTKDVININGVKFNTADMQASVEKILGDDADRVICFASRAERSHTEQVTVAYIPKLWATYNLQAAHRKIMEICLSFTGARPLILGLRDTAILPQTTLGKISGAKMRSIFEQGQFDGSLLEYELALQDGESSVQHGLKPEQSANDNEVDLLNDFRQVLDIVPGNVPIGLETPVFDIGFTSIDLIRLKRRIDSRLTTDVPVITLMKNPSVRSLAKALDTIVIGRDCNTADSTQARSAVSVAYDPIVALRDRGNKTPLWLIHPGVGEVLVFVGLAQQLGSDNRPVYALRARGFESGQSLFASITDMVNVYVGSIQARQPHGPYALAGYSYGAIVAFEIAKKLMSRGEEVRFLASFNLPPHIAWRMRQLCWTPCLLHLGLFLGLVDEDWVDSQLTRMGNVASMSREEALKFVRQASNDERWAELGLNKAALGQWTDVAYGLQSLAVDYEPAGLVKTIDVFYASPLKVAAASREEWVNTHLLKWRDFSESAPRFHSVGGGHYTMLGPDYVAQFADSLVQAMKERGI